MATTAYGRYLSASQAAGILAYAGVGADDDIGEGQIIEYAGKVYWILQTGTKFPNPTATSPDGWHSVYEPSQEEIALGKLPVEQDPFAGLTGLLQTAAIVLAIVLGIQVVKAFK